MRKTKWHTLIQFMDICSSFIGSFFVFRIDWLSTTAGASSRAGHHFHKVIFYFFTKNRFTASTCMTQRIYNRNTDLLTLKFKFFFCPRICLMFTESVYFFKQVGRRIFTHYLKVSGTKSCLHHAACGTENYAGAGVFAHEFIKWCIRYAICRDMFFLQKSCNFSGGKNHIHIICPKGSLHGIHVALCFFRNARHDGNRKDFFRINSDFFCKVSLHYRTEHLLWTLCGRKLWYKFRKLLFNKANPSRTAAGKHRIFCHVSLAKSL